MKQERHARHRPLGQVTSVLEARSPAAAAPVRSWRLHLRTTTELQDLAECQPIVQGWMSYYGRFCRTALDSMLRCINSYLMRWAQRKYKRLRPFRKARRWWHGLTARQPRMFAHWAWMNEF